MVEAFGRLVRSDNYGRFETLKPSTTAVDPNQAREMLDFRMQIEEAQSVHESLTVMSGKLTVLIDQDRCPWGVTLSKPQHRDRGQEASLLGLHAKQQHF
eukprot:jgi/Astpho2/7966/Aster-06563